MALTSRKVMIKLLITHYSFPTRWRTGNVIYDDISPEHAFPIAINVSGAIII